MLSNICSKLMQKSGLGILASFLLLLTAGPALADQQTSLSVGDIKSFRIRRQVVRSDVSVAPAVVGGREVEIARAWFDRDANRLRIRGVRPGTTVVTFSGSYRRILVGNRLEDTTRPFTDQVRVTVRAPRPDVSTVGSTITLGGTKPNVRTYRLSLFLGRDFRVNREDWGDVDVRLSDGRIARARIVDGDRLEIQGLREGTARITLRTDRKYYGTTREVVRYINIRVR